MVRDNWKNITKSPAYAFAENSKECFMRDVSSENNEAKSLIYSIGKGNGLGDVTYFVKLFDRTPLEMTEDNSKLIAIMIAGGLAQGGQALLEKIWVMDGMKGFPGETFAQYLLNTSDEFGELLPLFEDIPTKNDFYKKEMETLIKLKEYDERIRTGKLTDDQRKLSYAYS